MIDEAILAMAEARRIDPENRAYKVLLGKLTAIHAGPATKALQVAPGSGMRRAAFPGSPPGRARPPAVAHGQDPLMRAAAPHDL